MDKGTRKPMTMHKALYLRHAGHCWRSRDELIRDVLLWTPTHGRAKAGRPARIYIQQLCEDTGCCPEDLPRAMNDREEWRERVRDIRATSAIWWWWYVSRKEEQASIEDSLDGSIRWLEDYIKNEQERLNASTRNDTNNLIINTNNHRAMKIGRKKINGYLKRRANGISHGKTWTWLRKGNLKRETESLLIATQNNTMEINYVKQTYIRRCHWCNGYRRRKWTRRHEFKS